MAVEGGEEPQGEKSSVFPIDHVLQIGPAVEDYHLEFLKCFFEIRLFPTSLENCNLGFPDIMCNMSLCV